MHVTARWSAGITGVIGCWLVAAPFVVGGPAIGRWNDATVGAAIALLGGYNYVRERDGRSASDVVAVLVTILGGWLVVAPFVLGFEGAALWNDVVSGTLVASFAGYNAYVASVADGIPSRRMSGE